MTDDIVAEERARYLAANRARWDERVPIHLRDTTGIYPIDAFRAGEDLLGPIESAEIGNVAGKRLLHLQCHFGIDTLCLARRGALATGVDFSPLAIQTAQAFAEELNVPARFAEGNVYDAPALVGTGYDVVFTSWGSIVWLPDIWGWAEIVASCLAPGGRLYFADAHPTLRQIEEVGGRLELQYDWKTPPERPILETSDESYAGDGTRMANHEAYSWNHSMSDILGALSAAGLSLQYLREHEMIPWQAFASMRRQGRMFVQAEGQIRIPLAMSLSATKAG